MSPRFPLIGRWALALCLVALPLPATAQTAAPATRVLFTNVNVFDGEHEALIGNASVLVEGNLITRVSTQTIRAEGATVIDGRGRTLMPGLIDAHWHTMFNFWPMSRILAANFGYLSIAAAHASRETLLRGFTTVRDVGANSFGVKHAIDAGLAEGPAHLPLRPVHRPDVRAWRLPGPERCA